MAYRIVYPEKRFVSDRQIEIWYADACANGEIDHAYLNTQDHWTMAQGLSDAGIITLAKDQTDGCC